MLAAGAGLRPDCPFEEGVEREQHRRLGVGGGAFFGEPEGHVAEAVARPCLGDLRPRRKPQLGA